MRPSMFKKVRDKDTGEEWESAKSCAAALGVTPVAITIAVRDGQHRDDRRCAGRRLEYVTIDKFCPHCGESFDAVDRGIPKAA